MKRIVGIILSLAMLMTMNTTSFANANLASSDIDSKTYSINLNNNDLVISSKSAQSFNSIKIDNVKDYCRVGDIVLLLKNNNTIIKATPHNGIKKPRHLPKAVNSMERSQFYLRRQTKSDCQARPVSQN